MNLSSDSDWLQELRTTAAARATELQPDISRWTRLNLPDNLTPQSVAKLQINIEGKLEGGIICTDIATALSKYSSIVKSYLAKAVACDDKLSALNLQHFTNGLFLYVPKGVEVKVPFTAVTHIPPDSRVWTRNLVIADEGSKVSLIENLAGDETSEASQSLFSSALEIFVADNAELSLSTIQNLSPATTFLRHARALVGRDSRVNWTTATLGSGVVRAKRETVFNGPGSEINDIEVFFGTGKQHFDLTANILHKHPSTKSNVLVKGILNDKARALSYGLIRIDKQARGCDSFLAEHGLLLSSAARCDTTPSLEIEESDVRAGHSASVSQLDEEQIFYLMARGLTRETARKLIALGFLEPALKKLSPAMKEKVGEVIERKWGE